MMSGSADHSRKDMQWGATFGFYAPRGFTICGKKAEGVFSRWARGDTDFPMAAGAASAIPASNETHGENHELRE